MSDSVSIRSIIFTPALRTDRLRYAAESGADVCLLDLEDSVGEHDKNAARESLCAYFNSTRCDDVLVAVRINGLHTDFGIDDLLALRECQYKPHYVVVPKAESAADIRFVEQLLGKQAMHVSLIALLETVDGIKNASAIATASRRMSGLMFGSADYTKSIGAEICWDTLLLPRSSVALDARRAGIAAIDTPFFDIPDLEALKLDCQRVRKLGFTGRCVIHPSQTNVVNTAFSYSLAAIERAQRIVAAAKVSGGNICQVDGQMVGAPIVEKARRILELVGNDTTAHIAISQ